MIILKRFVLTIYLVVLIVSFCLFLLFANLYMSGWRLEPTTILTKISKESTEYEFGFVDTGYSDYSYLKDEYSLNIETDWPEIFPDNRIEDIFANAIGGERYSELIRKDPEIKLAWEVWIDGKLAKEGKFKVFRFVDYDEPKNAKIVARVGEFGCKSGVVCLVKVRILESPDDFYEFNPRFLVSEYDESKGRTFHLWFALFLTMVFGGMFLILLSSGAVAYFLLVRREKKRKK